MKNPLCRYCGKPMIIEDVDYYGTSYECRCKGYLKEKEFEHEVRKIERDLTDKKTELENHRWNSLYNRSIRDLESKIVKIKSKYYYEY